MSKDFTRHAAHRKKRLQGTGWRRPKGLHNKLRDQKRGSGRLVKSGYRTAAESRGKKNGLTVVTVYNEKDLSSLDAKEHGVVIGKVGLKKKLSLLDAIEKAGLTLLTGKPAEAKKALQQQYEERRKELAETREEREKARKELEKQADEKEAAGKEDKDADSEEKDSGDSKASKKPAKKAAKKAAGEQDEKSEKSKEDLEKEKVLTKAR